MFLTRAISAQVGAFQQALQTFTQTLLDSQVARPGSRGSGSGVFDGETADCIDGPLRQGRQLPGSKKRWPGSCGKLVMNCVHMVG